MEKWADYLVSAVRYEDESDSGKILYLKVHQFNGDEIGSGTTWSREEMIRAMQEGKTFSTIFKNGTAEWIKGRRISLIKLRLDYALIDMDNSGRDLIANLKAL